MALSIKRGANLEYTAGITHDTRFHSDDVFATALLTMVARYQNGIDVFADSDASYKNGQPEFTVARLPMKIAEAISSAYDSEYIPGEYQRRHLVFDVGNGEFDHHASPRLTRENGIPYCAFGKLWMAFGPYFGLRPEYVNAFDVDFVQYICANDNEGVPNPISSTISLMNTDDPKDDDAQRTAFDGAVEYAYKTLWFQIKNLLKRQEQYGEITSGGRSVKCKMGGNVVVYDKYYTAYSVEELRPNDVAMIYPHNRGGWALQSLCDRKGPGQRINRWKAPDDLWGKPEWELRQRIQGLRFCHASGFMCTFDDYEEALAFAMDYV